MGLAITGALAVMCWRKFMALLSSARRVPKKPKTHLCAAPDERKRSGTGDLLRIGGVAAPWLLPMLSAAVPLPWSLLTPPFLNQ